MTGLGSKRKGYREEAAVVAAWQCEGFHAERVPLSGAAGGSYTGDLTIAILNDDRKVECKVRANGFKSLYEWLGVNWCLTLRADRKERLYVMREADFMRLCMAAERGRV
jgi:hypothetical protein